MDGKAAGCPGWKWPCGTWRGRRTACRSINCSAANARDRIRLYCDTTGSSDPDVYARRMKGARGQGLHLLKMDFGIPMIRNIPGALSLPGNFDWRSYQQTEHPFTQVQITEKGPR